MSTHPTTDTDLDPVDLETDLDEVADAVSAHIAEYGLGDTPLDPEVTTVTDPNIPPSVMTTHVPPAPVQTVHNWSAETAGRLVGQALGLEVVASMTPDARHQALTEIIEELVIAAAMRPTAVEAAAEMYAADARLVTLGRDTQVIPPLDTPGYSGPLEVDRDSIPDPFKRG